MEARIVFAPRGDAPLDFRWTKAAAGSFDVPAISRKELRHQRRSGFAETDHHPPQPLEIAVRERRTAHPLGSRIEARVLARCKRLGREDDALVALDAERKLWQKDDVATLEHIH